MQSSEQQINNSTALELFRAHIEGLPGSSAREYRKAFAYLAEFFGYEGDSLAHITPELVEDWGIYMHWQGMTTGTVAHYIDIASALFSHAERGGVLVGREAFKTVKARIRQGLFLGDCTPFGTQLYERFKTLLSGGATISADKRVFLDILRISLLAGCRSLGEIALLRKDGLDSLPVAAAAIAEAHCAAGRQYVFPLSQSRTTPGRLAQYVEGQINSLLSRSGIRSSVMDACSCAWAKELKYYV